jgi:orotidine-5'-phosphate decarboxylase
LPFANLIRASSERTQSRIVLALDLESEDPHALFAECKEILEDVDEYVCAVKVNRQLVLSLGLPTVSELVAYTHELSLPAIMDAKLNDVGHTNSFMMRSFVHAGFDAVIASPITGWKGGMDSVFESARKADKGVILLVYMSNPGAEQFYSMIGNSADGQKPIFERFAQMGVEWQADGLVIGATQPEIIRRVRTLVGPSMGIYSPGVGTQGGDGKKALQAGSTYLIVGRAIYASPNPRDSARELYESLK